MRRLPLEAQTIYAELVDQLTALEASRALGSTPGAFVTKTVKGKDYYYFQHADAAGHRHQVYLGRRDEVLDDLVRRFTERRVEMMPDRESVERLGSSLRSLGAAVSDTRSARVIRGSPTPASSGRGPCS